MSKDSFDVVVIGGGPGGYVAAIRAAQLGMTVACVDKRGAMGGTCLNIGCIPSKALLHASEQFHHAGSTLATLGVEVGKPKLNLKAMMAHKDKVVGELTGGIDFLLKKNKVENITGTAKITGPGNVEVRAGAGKKKRVLTAKNIIIATGSDVASLPGIKIDEKRIVSSTGALSLPKVPKKLVVIGGGIIGLELGSVWARLGAAVTVIEFLDRIAPGMDGEVVRQFQRSLTKQGFDFKLSSKVTAAKATTRGVSLTVEPAAGGDSETLAADVVLVAVGRRPFTDKLGLDAVGVELDQAGRIKTDGHFQTSAKGIYAIGDVIDGPMLAHKAEEDGVACAEILAGQAGHVNYDLVPGVVYTTPEVAWVGKTEEDLKADGIAYVVGKFPFTANAKAKAQLEAEGFVKVISDATTDRLLGVHIMGPDAGNLISEAVAVMEFGGSAEDIARTCHPHPTLSEAVKEAAMATAKRAIHA